MSSGTVAGFTDRDSPRVSGTQLALIKVAACQGEDPPP